MVSGRTFSNETAYSPNMVKIERDHTWTYVSKDFGPHTVTSGSFANEDAGGVRLWLYGPKSTF